MNSLPQTPRPQSIRRTIISLVGASLLLGSGVVGVAPSTAAPAKTKVNDCGALERKPADVVIRCADGYTMVTDVKWSAWKSARANGRGIYQVGTKEYPARITLNAPKTQAGERVFTRMIVSFVGNGPRGKKSLNIRMTPYVAPAAPTPESSLPPESGSGNVAPSATPTPAPSASATPSPTPSASPSPSVSASASGIAEVVPTVTLNSITRTSTTGIRVLVDAYDPTSKARIKRGIKSVTVYRPNEYNAEIAYKANYIGEDTTDQTEWSAVLPCDRQAKMKDTLRIEAVTDDGKKTSINVPQTIGSC